MLQYSLLQIPQQTYRVFLKNFLLCLKCAVMPIILSACIGAFMVSRVRDIPFSLLVLFALLLIFIIPIPFLKAWCTYVLNPKARFTYKSSIVWNRDTWSFFFTSLKLFFFNIFLLLVATLPILAFNGVLYLITLPFTITLEKMLILHYALASILAFIFLLFIIATRTRVSILLPARADKQPLTIKKALQITKNDRGKILLDYIIFFLINTLLSFVIGFVLGIIFGTAGHAHQQTSVSVLVILGIFSLFIAYMIAGLYALYAVHLYKHFTKKQ